MIRFIDLRGQGTGARFAFFDTIKDAFVFIRGEQVWRDRADLEEIASDLAILPRLVGLMPEWAHVPMTDDDEEMPITLITRSDG